MLGGGGSNYRERTVPTSVYLFPFDSDPDTAFCAEYPTGSNPNLGF